MSISRLLPIALLLAGSLLAAPARALPQFPADLQRIAEMPCTPPCTICHRDNNGGLGTIDKPFGLNMQLAGLQPVPNTLEPALDFLRNAQANNAQAICERTLPAIPGVGDVTSMIADNGQCDSDGDGSGDFDELTSGLNPSAPDEDVCDPRAYGCGARLEPEGRLDGWASLLGLVLALGLFARRRR